MTLKEQNTRLMVLLHKLVSTDDRDGVELIEQLLKDTHPSLKKSFEIMTEHYLA